VDRAADPSRRRGVAALLAMPLGLDVWERGGDHLVVMATERQLAELERRRLARVERLSTRDQYISRMQPDAAPPDAAPRED
jgi:hypothetical protein